MVGINAKLISWRNEGDPAIGNYSLEMEPNGGGELYIKQIGGKTLWRSEIWPSFSPVGSLYSFSFVDRAFLTYKVKNESAVVRVVLSYSGVIIHFLWQESSQAWVHLAFQPADSCKVFARCGPNAVCDIRYSPSCKCLDGFVPQVKDDFSRGCTRMKPLQCDEDKTEFMELTNIRFPAYAQTLEIAMKGVCEFVCRGNCSCTAYANSNGGGCLLFTGGT
ncbi:G-type lectin S-receptor-like serine/threonine-protein kinase At4g27290 [Salvia splendens]|uniref:G-type lectin S-receptor-like serine/threonine-protein kinase At4g27290 n=1 Tax=Salvia splendens TaxID=180675 RepID=UPI001C257F27|nr:G-type lectin S-receptor-like serine/threonine-protein kinase At4g27290 [Salvia splendens]XP_042066731.1 G-type lectin S-receptor-like serine/threonine-protein kinase At4g27290 [Salvia splendens]